MDKPEKWKVIGGGIIVAVAFAIMMPGVLDYVGRIGKVLLLVIIALSIALVAVLIKHKAMATRSKRDTQVTVSGSSTSEASDS